MTDERKQDGPTGETADALRAEGCVYGGVAKDGLQYWEHEAWSSFAGGRRVKSVLADYGTTGICLKNGRMMVASPELCAVYRSQGLLTRGEPKPKRSFGPCTVCDVERTNETAYQTEDGTQLCQECFREQSDGDSEEYPGFEYVGTAHGCRVHVGPLQDEGRTIPKGMTLHAYYVHACDQPDRDFGKSLTSGKRTGTSIAVTPEVLAVLDTWVDWTNRVVRLSPPEPPTYPGLEYVGTAQGNKVFVGTGNPAVTSGLSLMLKPENCEEHATDAGYWVRGMFSKKGIVVSPESLVVLDTWVKWDERIAHLKLKIDIAVHQTAVAIKPHRSYSSKKTTETSRPLTFAEAAKPLVLAATGTLKLIRRCRVWGEMMTEREVETGPILTCLDDSGIVLLDLDRLSDDRGVALKQLVDAGHRVGASRTVIESGSSADLRMKVLGTRLDETRNALDVGWPLPPFLQRIRDAHEAIGIERDWQKRAKGILPVGGDEPGETPVAVAGQAGPGWRRRC